MSALAATSDREPYTCDRAGHLGFDFKAASESKSFASADPNGQTYFFQKRKFDSYCHKYVPGKKDPTVFTKKENQKSGTRYTCLCGTKASAGVIKSMFQAIDGQVVSEINWTELNCKWDEGPKSNKLWSRGGNPYVDPKKGTCDDGSFKVEIGKESPSS